MLVCRLLKKESWRREDVSMEKYLYASFFFLHSECECLFALFALCFFSFFSRVEFCSRVTSVTFQEGNQVTELCRMCLFPGVTSGWVVIRLISTSHEFHNGESRSNSRTFICGIMKLYSQLPYLIH